MSEIILNTEFQYYPSKVYVTEPLGKVKLKDMLNAIKNPKEKIKSVFKQIQKATLEGNMELKDKLKSENLFYFTPSVTTDNKGRRYENIIQFNELMVVEFDKIDFAQELKKYLFCTLKCVVAAFTSPSGKGCKFIIKIPRPKNVEDYKSLYCGLAYHLDKIEGFDTANFNPLLPLYLSWDSDILIRDNPSIWTGRGQKVNYFTLPPDTSKIEKKIVAIGEQEKSIVVSKINNIFAKIHDNGHTQLVSGCLAIGGYIGAGYISEWEALNLVNNKIENNFYMSKNINGYKKTAMRFLRDGQRAPLYINNLK